MFAEDEAALIRRWLHEDAAIEQAVASRENGMPLEQVIGRAEFAGVVVEVADGVFVPRSRAAPIVDEAARVAPDANLVVDLGCGRVDLAVAYLPHVPSDRFADIHRDFRSHEPRSAVDGGPDGLDHLRTVLADLPSWLSPTGVFVTLVAAEQYTSDALARWRSRWVVEGRRTEDADVVLTMRMGGSEA